jgi:Pyruvate kinase, barrel domain
VCLGCSERKNVNLPGVVVDLPTLTPKDEEDLVKWGLPNDIDFIAASFVRKASDLDYIRKVGGSSMTFVDLATFLLAVLAGSVGCGCCETYSVCCGMWTWRFSPLFLECSCSLDFSHELCQVSAKQVMSCKAGKLCFRVVV